DVVAVTFTGLPLNGAPTVTAAATDANPLVGENVTLQGTSFDRDGDALTYLWTQTQGPVVPLSPSETSLAPSFVAPDTSSPLRFALVAFDGMSYSVAATTTVVVDRPPTASIVVSPTSGPPGTTVTFSGTGSADPEGQTLTFRWTQLL